MPGMTVGRYALLAALFAAFALFPRCSRGEEGVVSLQLTSPAFTTKAAIPARHTCDGAETSPPLRWSGVPEGTRSLALVVDDPDAPDPAAPQRTWVHWVLYDLPPSADGLAEGVAIARLPAGTREGSNDWRRTGYGGPCPPIGRHRYFFRLYALDVVLPDLQRPDKATLAKAMAGHVLAQAELVGTYQRGH
jgi:Raf kinase inhibitor-like YbhB/YbcL family protein